MTYPHGGASQIWRDGSGGAHNPMKSQIRDWATKIENRVDGTVTIFEFGAVHGGEISASLQASFDSGASVVIIPDGSFTLANPGVDVPSDVNVRQMGAISINTAIPAATITGAIRIENQSNVLWEISKFDASGMPTYDNNVFVVTGSTNVEIRLGNSIDSANDRFPLGFVRSNGNTRFKLIGGDITNSGGICHEGTNNTHSRIEGVGMYCLGQRSACDVSGGSFNHYVNNTFSAAANTTTSAFSFNDEKSVDAGNISVGGAFGQTVGHVGNQADHSAVFGNISDVADSIGFNIQATQLAAVFGNPVAGSPTTGVTCTSGAKFNTVFGHPVEAGDYGVRPGGYTLAMGNISVGADLRGYSSSFDAAKALYVGNMAVNGGSVGFEWGIVSGQKNSVLVGNFAGDDQATPTQTHGFRSLSAQNHFVGNATDGNHVTAEFDGTFSSIPNKDLSETTIERAVTVNGSTVNLAELPTSATGLATGDLWNDAGTVKVA